ncbi:MAG: hypothetical protein M3Q56_03605 [Bacteroidota bacterium]|nr:hypothetical protein [Bacteroidota bacterium]
MGSVRNEYQSLKPVIGSPIDLDAKCTFWIFCLCLFVFDFSFAQNNIYSTKTINKIQGDFVFFSKSDSLKITGLSNLETQLYFLIFHAEKDSIGLDPGLSTDGRWRAIHLMNILKPLNIKGFITTPFRRNILTLQPLVDLKKEKIKYYDQADLESLYKNLDNFFPDPIVMVIHPETLPKIYEYYMKNKFSEMLNGDLSNRFFILERTKKGAAKFHSLKYNIR